MKLLKCGKTNDCDFFKKRKKKTKTGRIKTTKQPLSFLFFFFNSNKIQIGF